MCICNSSIGRRVQGQMDARTSVESRLNSEEVILNRFGDKYMGLERMNSNTLNATNMAIPQVLTNHQIFC